MGLRSSSWRAVSEVHGQAAQFGRDMRSDVRTAPLVFVQGGSALEVCGAENDGVRWPHFDVGKASQRRNR